MKVYYPIYGVQQVCLSCESVEGNIDETPLIGSLPTTGKLSMEES